MWALVLADRIAGASVLALLFVVVVLFRTLPRMKSLKALGVEAEWFQEVTEKVHVSTTGTAELRAELRRMVEDIKVLNERQDLPPETLPALQQLNSTASLANQKLTIVENANTALDTLLSKGTTFEFVPSSAHLTISRGEPILKVGGDPNDKPRSK